MANRWSLPGRALQSAALIILLLFASFPQCAFTSIAATASNEKKETTFDFSLRECEASSSQSVALAPALEKELSEDRTKQIMRRLSPLPAAPGKSFVLPEQSLVKPDLPGRRIEETFPPASGGFSKPQDNSKPQELRVVRVSPTGALDTSGQLTVTFSQPMIAVSQSTLESHPEK